MTVMMDVWDCFSKGNISRPRGNVEQRRLSVLHQEAPAICSQITQFAERIFLAQVGLSTAHYQLSLDQVLIREAESLIPTVIEECSHDLVVDDRPIYWGRLFTQFFFDWFNRKSIPRSVRNDLCRIYELTSRCYANERARTAPIHKRRVILTAFDPFLLNNNIEQSNPSASIALNLAERYKDSIPIEVFIFPVRYQDFNKGAVEQFLKPRFERDPLCVLTLSMGREHFDLERFIGCRRSSPALDNLDYSPVRDGRTPRCLTKCPEFLEFNLPTETLVSVEGQWETRDNRKVTTQSKGEFEAQSLQELEGKVCIQGSGGGFLSNEIAYRSRLLQLKMDKSFPLGHLHVPKISKFVGRELQKMTHQTAQILDRLLAIVT